METAKCINCGRILDGKPYHFGSGAYFPDTTERVPANFYGGYVCSESCDIKHSLYIGSSMPGAGKARFSRVSGHTRNNWR